MLKTPEGILLDFDEARTITRWLGNGTPQKEHKTGLSKPESRKLGWIYDDFVELIGDYVDTCQSNRKGKGDTNDKDS